MLEQQWVDQPKPRILQVSKGFTYRWSASAPVGSRVLPGSMSFNGRPIDPAATYRVTVNNYLANGGDNFNVLREGANRVTGPYDVDVLASYLGSQDVVMPGPLDRIVRVD
jgi:5'-nucleotidase